MSDLFGLLLSLQEIGGIAIDRRSTFDLSKEFCEKFIKKHGPTLISLKTIAESQVGLAIFRFIKTKVSVSFLVLIRLLTHVTFKTRRGCVEVWLD